MTTKKSAIREILEADVREYLGSSSFDEIEILFCLGNLLSDVIASKILAAGKNESANKKLIDDVLLGIKVATTMKVNHLLGKAVI